LKKWGRAYAHISRERREAIVSAMDPRVDYPLKDETVFTRGKEARENLFTSVLLNLIFKVSKMILSQDASKWQLPLPAEGGTQFVWTDTEIQVAVPQNVIIGKIFKRRPTQRLRQRWPLTCSLQRKV
jgi:hypothetical protein